MIWLLLALAAVLALWAVARFYLAGEDLSRYDVPTTPPLNDAPSAASSQVLETVRGLIRDAESRKGRERLAHTRRMMDGLGEQANLSGVDITPVTVAGRPAEWLVAQAAEPRGRLLYLHGGGFITGSPLSHRGITAELARRTGLAVLAIDYRLMPEHPRRAGIDDCRAAYRWILENGPPAACPDRPVFVAGDSAGGNLTLALIGWLRDQQRGGRPGLCQPDGAIALSPLTDATFASPSIRHNLDQDPLLGPMARVILRVPEPLRLWLSWLQNRIPPADPRLSPLHGDLDGLPPLLVQASETEILIDDARRYVNKARHSGSPAELQTWHGMVHVWQAFGADLPETEQAFTRMAEFVDRAGTGRGRADAA